MTLRQLKSTWENLGREDPLWAVLSDPDSRNGQWDLDEFMATGTREVASIQELLSSHGLGFGDRVLDFGCGVGRLTNALAEHVSEAVGVDLADSMVDSARKLNRHPSRVNFETYDGMRLPFDDGSFDSAISLMVLQHAPPSVQVGSLLELQRVVRGEGVLVVQIPSHPKLVAPLAPECQRAWIEIVDWPSSMVASQVAAVRATVTNVSVGEWPADHWVKLANHWFDGKRMIVHDDGRTALPTALGPGEAIELELHVTAPPLPGTFELELDVLQEFVGWWKDAGSQPARVDVQVIPAMVEPGEPVSVQRGEDETDSDVGLAIEMHGLHNSLAVALFKHCGGEVVAAVPEMLAGPDWESFTYLVRCGS